MFYSAAPQVVVLTSDNTILFDRLVKRGYKTNKVQENVECEIMRVGVKALLLPALNGACWR